MYKISINQKAQTVHEAAVSAYPLNRVWQGKQRSPDQTETAYFVTFDMEDKVKLEVEVAVTTIDKVEIRPFEYELSYTVKDNKITVEISEPCQFTIEVNGRHHALHVFANPPLVHRRSDNEIYFGPGEHHPGVIVPESGQTVYIDEGAVVYGAIFAYKVKDVHITGRGILDSSHLRRGEEEYEGRPGDEMADLFTRYGLPARDKKYVSSLVAYECENLAIDGIVLRNPMLWTMIIRNHCRNVMIDNVKLIGLWRYNSDGINICTSENVTVRNSFIRSFDDCLIARGAYLEGEDNCNLNNLLVENCVMWCDWGKSIEVWAGHLPGTIHDISFRNNYLIHLSAVAMDITTWFGSGKTAIRNIEFKDIFINTDTGYESLRIQKSDDDVYCSDPDFIPQILRIDCDRLGDFTGGQEAGRKQDASNYVVKYEHIVIDNIQCSGPGKANLSVLIDAKRNPVEIRDVKLRNIDTGNIVITGKIHGISVE